MEFLKQAVTAFIGRKLNYQKNPFDLDLHVQCGTCIAAGSMGTESNTSHSYDFDEIMIWIGADTDGMDDLGAEVEVFLGEEG
jgi:hypothetical protein